MPMAGTKGPRTSCAKSSKLITISSRLGSSEAASHSSQRVADPVRRLSPSTGKTSGNRNDMPAQAQAGVPGLPDMKVSVRQLFGIDTDLEVPAYSKADDHVPDLDNDYVFNREVTLAILAGFKHNRRVMIQGYHGTGKSTHIEQVAVAAQLALHPHQPRQPRQPHRPRRQGRDRAEGGQAGHRVPRGHPALLPADQHGAVLRRVRRRPPRRDVRHPARAGAVRQAHPARPVEGDPAASGVPAVLHHQHHRPRRHLRPLSRHAADQPGPDGPLVDRLDAQLPAARRGDAHRAGQGQVLQQERGQAQDRLQHGARRRPDALGLHQRRPLHRHEPAHGAHLGGERRDLRRHRLCLPRSPSSTSATSWSGRWWPSSTSAASARSCPRAPSTWR